MSTQVAKIGDLSAQIRGVSYSKGEVSNDAEDGLKPILRAGNITEEGLTRSDLQYVPIDRISANQLIRRGDVVIAASTGSRRVIGKAAQAKSDFDGAFGAFCKVLRPNEKVDHSYFGHYFQTRRYREKVASLAGGANINNLRNEHLNDLEVLLPPLEEQRRIAAILDKADELRTKRREAIAKLDTLAQSIFIDMFGDPTTNPMGWDQASISDICSLVRGSSPRPKADPRFYGGPIPRLMVADITRDGWEVTPRIDSLTVEGAKFSRPIKSGTVVMAVSGNVGLVSRLAVDACVHDGFVAFKELDINVANSVYLLAVLHLLKQTHETRRAGAIFQNLTTRDIKSMKIPIPPLELQREIANRFDFLGAIRRTYIATALSENVLFSSLQQRAFKGEL